MALYDQDADTDVSPVVILTRVEAGVIEGLLRRARQVIHPWPPAGDEALTILGAQLRSR